MIAAAALRSLAAKDPSAREWNIASAGTWTTRGLPPVPEALSLAKKLGLRISPHRSREVDKSLLDQADIVIVMTESHREALELEFQQAREKVFLLSEIFAGEVYDIPDPFTQAEDPPEVIGKEIYSLINSGYQRFAEIVRQVKSK